MSHMMQAAFQESCARFDNGYGAIGDLISAGRFVAVIESPAFCPSTDAIMGSRFSIVSDHSTREEAELALAAVDDGESYYDCRLEVWPRLPVAARTFADDEEILF